MIKYCTLLRTYLGLPRRLAIRSFSSNAKSNSTSSSSASSSSDDESKPKAEKQKRSEEALNKLNLLLNAMIKEDTKVTNEQSKLELAKPRGRGHKDIRSEDDVQSVKSEPVEKQVMKAAKDVAESIGGDVKQTESELLQKLLSPVKEESTQATAANLSEIFKDMKIDRESKVSEEASRAQQVRQLLQTVKASNRQPLARTRPSKRGPKFERAEPLPVEERVKLFGDRRLNIFPSPAEMQAWPEQDHNKTWRALHERELRLAVTHPPANYFQQMILWTEQRKIWKFPIDNEQDLEEEKDVYFIEHVFLEKHLDPWCPPKGPVRHFMELVCVGLSKNCYLTVAKKKEHIEWFRDYFAEKKQLLKEVGAIPPGFEIESQAEAKKIES